MAGALPASRLDLVHAFRTGGRTSTSTRKRARDFLIVGQTALAVVLLTGAGLLITSFARLSAVDPGFDTANLAAVRFNRMPRTYGGKERRAEFEQQLLERVRAMPGVERAAMLSSFPLERGYNMAVTIDGRDDEAVSVEWRSVSADVFETLRIPLVRGRAFSDADRAGAPRVTIINEAFANRFWPGENPIGKQVAIGRYNGRWSNPDAAGPSEVIGVVSDIREVDLRRSAVRTAYVPNAQAPVGMMSAPKLVMRTTQQRALHAAVTETVHAIDPLIPPPELESITAIVSRSLAQDRFRMVLLSAFAVSALLLTAIGIYGLIAYSVRQQVREIGIRMVLGAQAGRVLFSIVSRGLILVAAGIVIGIVAALGLTRFISSVLYGVSATDAMTFVQVVAVLGVTALLAAYLPARRATRVAPTVALTSE
jgi:predicted permease